MFSSKTPGRHVDPSGGNSLFLVLSGHRHPRFRRLSEGESAGLLLHKDTDFS